MKKLWIFLLFGFIIILYPWLTSLDVHSLRTLLAPFGILAPAVFIGLYIIAGLFLAPLSLFSIAAGILFGTLWGFAIVLCAATASAILAFLIGRFFAECIPRANKGTLQQVQEKIERHMAAKTFHTILILRLIFLPYIELSYAAGLVKTCRFWPFVVATFLATMIGSFVFVYLGAHLGSGWRTYILPIVLVGVSFLLPFVIRWIRKRRKQETV
ncbi:TVP38/TMEM64 family protein [Candidatus Woesearchaeota archaeon]|nr:TVP38/TMEM64 family protein [Candidatus Woesearchaeota archaeon]